LASVILLVAVASPACAGPVILNFDALRQDDADLHVIAPVYQSQGFTLTATSTPFNPPNFSSCPATESALDQGLVPRPARPSTI
jgi:hypothetical protein